MWISKDYRFEASHVLPKHPGKCSRLHGHSYQVRVEIQGQVNADDGFVLDYWDLDDGVKPIIERLDHRHLNAFIAYPSAENIAVYIAYEIAPWFAVTVKPRHLFSYRVLVSETAKTWAVWESQKVGDQILLKNTPPLPGVPADQEARRQLAAHLEKTCKQQLEEFTLNLTDLENVLMYEASLKPANLGTPGVDRDSEGDKAKP